MREVVAEVVLVARAKGVELPGDIADRAIKFADAMPQTMSSTAQDIAKGKRTEIDHLNGYVARQGEALDIPTPVNRTLSALMKLLEQTIGRNALVPHGTVTESVQASRDHIRYRSTARSSHSIPMPIRFGISIRLSATGNGSFKIGLAQSCHSSQWAVSVTRMRCAATSDRDASRPEHRRQPAIGALRSQPLTPPIRMRSGMT